MCVSGIVAAFASVALVLSSSSAGSVTIGSDLSNPGEADHNCGTEGCTVIQTALPGRQLTAPFDGLIVRWRERDYGAGTATLRVVSLLSSSGPPWTTSFLRSSVAEPTGGLGVVTFPVSPPLPVAAGDRIGISASDDNMQGAVATGATDTIFGPASPLDGTTENSTNIKGMNIDWLYDADVVGRPTSTATAAACPGGSGATVTVTADPDPATGPKAVHFKVDGGPEEVVATTGSPGMAALAVPSGVHSLEFWGEDQLAQQEAAHHLISAGCPPALPIAPLVRPAVVSGATESARSWREGNALASASRGSRPVGTTFHYNLDKAAAVRFGFTESLSGRQVRGGCIGVTNANKNRRRCTRVVAAGTLPFIGHGGSNSVHFEGRLSRTKRLKPGSYTLLITATTPGVGSTFTTLRFTILR